MDSNVTVFPQANISNGLIHARIFLPDPERGFYQATRFDWSGLIASLEHQGHSYFGPWFENHDPQTHDAVVGPAEEFQPHGGGPGYSEAAAGGVFVRIGVGVLRKPEEPAYRQFGAYEIRDHGKWAVHEGPGQIAFVHELNDKYGYAYVYRKTVRLADGAPELFLEHCLKNTGRHKIETTQYNHNFFVIDGEPVGPDFRIRFPFELRAAGDLKALAEVRGSELRYLRVLQKGESVFTPLEGFRSTAADYDIRVENRKTGAAVRIRGDRRLENLLFWSIRTTICPEPYVALNVAPGQTCRWTIRYSFYASPVAAAAGEPGPKDVLP